jgi:hypothetical protein
LSNKIILHEDQESYSDARGSISCTTPSEVQGKHDLVQRQQSRNFAGNKAAVLLDALILKDFSQVNREAQAAGIQEERLSRVSCRGLPASAEDVAIASAGTAEGILYRFQDLQALDNRSQALSVATNWAYWRLGVSYQTFVDVRTTVSKGRHSS